MTFRLVEDPDAVGVLAADVSAQTGIPAAHIEKDFWVTEVLRGVVTDAADIGIEVVFKGGTSLSKAYSLIERFSEDVDILVILPEGTKGDRDRILKALVAGGSRTTWLAPEPVSDATTKGEKRGARYHYQTTHTVGDGLSEGVFLELGSRGGAMPFERRPVQSMIAEHAGDRIVDAVEVEAFEVRVQEPARTLVEKLILLHTAHSAADEHAAVRGARHFYDVHQLVARESILDRVSEVGVAVLARDVCTYSTLADLPVEARPAAGFSKSAAFNEGPHVPAARDAYERRVVGQLLWPNATPPAFDECVDAVHRHKHRL